jgi:hypothetical protein
VHKQFNLKNIYISPEANGYGKALSYQRFKILDKLKFDSILDVGSGPCFLYEWLNENNKQVIYEAVDIRTDALNLCGCKTYTEIPNYKNFDLVCLFGTVTYNIDYNLEKNKNILIDCLQKSINVSNHYVLFTVMKNEINTKATIDAKRFVYYTLEEIKQLLNSLNIFDYEIIDNDLYDKEEYFIICNTKQNIKIT